MGVSQSLLTMTVFTLQGYPRSERDGALRSKGQSRNMDDTKKEIALAIELFNFFVRAPPGG